MARRQTIAAMQALQKIEASQASEAVKQALDVSQLNAEAKAFCEKHNLHTPEQMRAWIRERVRRIGSQRPAPTAEEEVGQTRQSTIRDAWAVREREPGEDWEEA